MYKIGAYSEKCFTSFSHFSMFFTEYATCVLTIRGNAFLWHQIRYIVSILMLIGQNKEEPGLILNLLDVTQNPR